LNTCNFYSFTHNTSVGTVILLHNSSAIIIAVIALAKISSYF